MRNESGDGSSGPGSGGTGRRDEVLESALETFARFGYRKTSMESVARAAQISRPGLYFLFTSKEELFRSAVSRAVGRDLGSVRDCLADVALPLSERLLEAFDLWAGRYVGPITRDIAGVIDDNPDLLTSVVDKLPNRFAQLIVDAIANDEGGSVSATEAAERAQTLISTSVGIKHQVDSRDEYRDRMALAIRLLLP